MPGEHRVVGRPAHTKDHSLEDLQKANGDDHRREQGILRRSADNMSVPPVRAIPISLNPLRESYVSLV